MAELSANSLKTTSDPIIISNAIPPMVGQVLVATSATTSLPLVVLF